MSRGWLAVCQRLLLSVVGGYFLSAGLATLLALPLAALVPRSEAVILMAMLAFVFYLVILLWGFAEMHSARLWGALGAGAVTVQLLVWWLGRAGAGG